MEYYEPNPGQITAAPSESHEFSQLEKTGDEYFKAGQFLKAVSIYQKMIESGYHVNFQIQGLGNFDHTVYRYEWGVYKWYDQQRKEGAFKGNAFDALSLCYCQLRNVDEEELEKGIAWYEDRLAEKQSLQLYIGYANILFNRFKYDKALKIYKKVLEIRPNFTNAQVSIMFLHQFRRVEKTKTIAMASKILEHEPENMYAHFILSKNTANVDQRIKKLTIAAEKFPNYVRLVNELGLSYGAKKDHKQAIFWYKKCVAIAPEYAQGYHNIAYRTQQLQDTKQALNWYFKAIEIDPKYKLAYSNAIKALEKLNYSNEDIINQTKKYPKMDMFNFYYYMGLANYDRPKYEVAITWYKRAESIDKQSFRIYNSLGLAYERLKRYQEAEKCYFQSIRLNPTYQYPYYNLGLLYKHVNKVDKAIEWYKKAIEVDPDYHPPYNNLGNIFRDQKDYKNAIKYYKKCVEINSTYTLVYANMGNCYLNMEMYPQAFEAFARAKQLLPTDNNGLNQQNKNFLNENLQKFNKQGEKWKKSGSMSEQQKENLKGLIKSFQSSFPHLYSADVEAAAKVSDQIALKPQILKIVNLIYEDKFSLKNIDLVFDLVKQIFAEDQDYFHIIPQLFVQYFWNSFKKNRPTLDIQQQVSQMIQGFSSKKLKKQGGIDFFKDIKFKGHHPSSQHEVNLFKDTAYFNSLESLYSQIDKANVATEKVLGEFTDLVDDICKRSNGIPSGVNMRIPKDRTQQFRVFLRIVETIFKRQIDDARMQSIISKIDVELKNGEKKLNPATIINYIMEVWTKEITIILQERFKNQIETKCDIADLVRGKIMFNSLADLEKAVEACDKLSTLREYKILKMINHSNKMVLNIQINEAVCELHLAMKQDEKQQRFLEFMEEIKCSPLGCILSSYLFMSKGFSYPFIKNCKDIEMRLRESSHEEDRKTAEAAQFIVRALQQESQFSK